MPSDDPLDGEVPAGHVRCEARCRDNVRVWRDTNAFHGAAWDDFQKKF
jgi:hypothetical protein